jgi:hypothetical protein
MYPAHKMAVEPWGEIVSDPWGTEIPEAYNATVEQVEWRQGRDERVLGARACVRADNLSALPPAAQRPRRRCEHSPRGDACDNHVQQRVCGVWRERWSEALSDVPGERGV